MRKWIGLGFAFVAAVGLAGTVKAQSTAESAAGLTGETKPQDMLDARRILMDTIGRNNDFLHDSVDGHFEFDPVEVRARLDAISSMLLAFPHLYHPNTNIWSEEAEAADASSVSLSLPTVWERWVDFYLMAQQASETALQASIATEDARTIELINELEMQCEACHDTFRQHRVSGREEFQTPE